MQRFCDLRKAGTWIIYLSCGVLWCCWCHCLLPFDVGAVVGEGMCSSLMDPCIQLPNGPQRGS